MGSLKGHLRHAITVAIAVAITSFVVARGQDSATTTVTVEPNGAAGGRFPAIVGNGWDLRGFRNLQGGWLSGDPETLNLDIGAGSTANPGVLSFNYDVGRATAFYDGHHGLCARVTSRGTELLDCNPTNPRVLALFGPGGITFYARPRVIAMRLRRKWR